MRSAIILLLVLLLLPLEALAEERVFSVRHDHWWKHCAGELIFGTESVTFQATSGDHTAQWSYADIQQLELAREQITILTYDARKRELGRDRVFRFRLTPGAATVPDNALREYLQKKLARPLVSDILPAVAVRFSLPARYRRFMGATQGVLEFADDYLLFRATRPADSRLWRYDDLLALDSTGPFRLRLGALENTGGEFGAEKPYNFDLKRRLTEAERDFLWEKINRRQIR